MSKDKQNKNQKKMATVDKTKVLSAYKSESQSKPLEVVVPKFKR